MPQKRMECFKLLLENLAWIKHQFLSGIRDSRKAGSLWGMMRCVRGVRKSIDQSWLAKGLGLGLLCWAFKGVQEEIPSEEASSFQIRSVGFPAAQYTSPQLHPCLSLWDNWGDERGCDEGHWHAHTRGLPYGLPKVVGTVQQVYCSRRRLLRRRLEFHVCTINKSGHTKKSLETYLMILIYIYIYIYIYPNSKAIWVRRIRHAGHCLGTKDKFVSDILLWIPTREHTSVGRPAKTYIHQDCIDT